MACCAPLVQGSFHHGFGQLVAGFAGLVQALLELVAEGHEFIDFLDDAVLLFERGQRYSDGLPFRPINDGGSRAGGLFTNRVLKEISVYCRQEIAGFNEYRSNFVQLLIESTALGYYRRFTYRSPYTYGQNIPGKRFLGLEDSLL